MSAMKEIVIELQERAEQKLLELGVDKSTLYEMEEKLQEQNKNWQEIAELMAGYEMFIQTAAQSTPYSKERLWSIWKNQVEDFKQGNLIEETLEEVWKNFKAVIMEEDW